MVGIEYLLLILSCISATLIITRSKLLVDIRIALCSRYNTEFFRCGQCVGFHIGWIGYFLYVLMYTNEFLLTPSFLFFLFSTALLSSMFSYFTVLIHDKLMAG